MKKQFLAWFDWKNPDEMKSRMLSETNAEIHLNVHMTLQEFADVMKALSRQEFFLTFEKGESK